MKIIQLTAENIKRLTAVSITPEGNLVVISGKNGQGKTSVLDAIWWALAGKDTIQSSPIRKGQGKARIELKLGALVVERKFTRIPREDGTEGEEYNTSLTVTSAEGARYPSPQSMLDALLGELSFDPLAFVRMEPKAQREALKKFVVGVDLDKIDRDHGIDYATRADANRRAKELSAQAGDVNSSTPLMTGIDEQAILNELEEAGRCNTEIATRKGEAARALDVARNILARAKQDADRAAELEEEIADLRASAKSERLRGEAAMKKAQDEVEAIPLQTVTLDLRKKYDDAVQHNERVKDQLRRLDFSTRADELVCQALAITQRMAERQAAKNAAVAGAKLPVEGLTFTDTGVLFNDVPLAQASDAEQLRVGVAVATALNPKLRVIRVREGSTLDSDGIALLGQLAQEADMQVWVERVSDGGGVGFIVEDGHLKS